MSLRPSAVILLLLGLAPPAQPQQPQLKAELNNRSDAPWKITLVEGKRSQVGALRIIHKFSGQLALLGTRTGDSLVLPPGSSFLLDLAQGKPYFHHDFILEDHRGNYAEFVATVRYLANPQLSMELKGRRVGSPLNQAPEEEITRALEAAIRTDQGDLVIVQNSIGLSPSLR